MLLAVQIISASVTKMIRDVIKEYNVVLYLRNKGMYNYLADLYETWNDVVDNCNGRDGPHLPENAL